MIKIVLKGKPISTQSLYLQKGKMRFMKMEAKLLKLSYMRQVVAQTKNKKSFNYEPVEVEMNIYFADRQRRDIDNFNKLALDSMEGKVYNDDKQIQKITIEKFYDKEDPRIELKILNYKSKGN